MTSTSDEIERAEATVRLHEQWVAEASPKTLVANEQLLRMAQHRLAVLRGESTPGLLVHDPVAAAAIFGRQ